MTSPVLIRGGGIAAYACAQLLRRASIPAVLEGAQAPRIPVLMLADQAVALLRDVFDQPTLFADAPRIRERRVAWGDGAAGAMPHAAVVVSEQALRDLLGIMLQDALPGVPAFTVHAMPPLPAERRRFGARRAATMPVRQREPNAAACLVESLAAGWLFLIPETAESAWLLAVGGAPADLLAESRLIGPGVDLIADAAGDFDASPAISVPGCGEGWLACGPAAVAFDPICGDGTSHAVREAILAAAVIAAILKGGNTAALLTHYDTMLTGAMRRHLKLCAEFYATGGGGPWWQGELAALAEGYDWCTARLAAAPEPRYMLKDFDLVERP